MKQKKNLRQIFSVFLTCMMIIGVALANDHIFVEGEGKPQAEQQVQEQQEPGEQEQGDPEKPGEQKPGQGQGEIQEGKPQQEPEQGQELGQGQGDSGKPGELPGKPEEVNQRGGQELTDITISELKITDRNDKDLPIKEGEQFPECGYWNNYRIHMKFDTTAYGGTLKKGDYFEVTLSNRLKFFESDVDIMTDDNTIITKAHITPNKAGGGTMRVTFEKDVSGISTIKCYTDVTFAHNSKPKDEDPDNGIHQEGGIYEIIVKVGKNSMRSLQIKVKPRPSFENEYFTKYPLKVDDNPYEVKWTIRLNVKGEKNYNNLVIKDKLYVAGQNINYVKDSFKLQEVKYDKYANKKLLGTPLSESDLIREGCLSFLNEEGNPTFKFEYGKKFGNMNGRQYEITYKSTYIPGFTLKNEATFNSDEQKSTGEPGDPNTVKSSFTNEQAGGSAEGDLKGQIKIVKVDGWDTTIKLKGAEFTIKKAGKNNPVIETKTTDVNGEAIFEKLAPGSYSIKEIKAPDHYTIEGSETHSVDLKTGEFTQINIGNAPGTIDIEVRKEWVGADGKPITAPVEKINFRFYDKSGKPVEDEKNELNKNKNWKNIFDVREYAKGENGNKIEYTVKEVDPQGKPIEAGGSITIGGNEYIVTYSGSMKDGLVITNTKKSNPPNPGGGGSGGGSGGTGGDDSNKPKPNDPKPNDPKPNDPKPSDDSTGMGGATPPDGSVVPNDSTTATNTVAPKNHKTPKNPVLTDKQGVKKTAQAGRRLPKTGEGANPTLYAWMLCALGSMLVLVGYRKRKTVK